MYIYIITHPKFPGWIKLGRTNNINIRLSHYQTCCPDRDYRIEFKLKTKYTYNIENYFENSIKNNGYEWFKCSVEFAIYKINDILKEIELNPYYFGQNENKNKSICKKRHWGSNSKYNFITDGKYFNSMLALIKYTKISRIALLKEIKKDNKHGTVYNIDGYEIIMKRLK